MQRGVPVPRFFVRPWRRCACLDMVVSGSKRIMRGSWDMMHFVDEDIVDCETNNETAE